METRNSNNYIQKISKIHVFMTTNNNFYLLSTAGHGITRRKIRTCKKDTHIYIQPSLKKSRMLYIRTHSAQCTSPNIAKCWILLIVLTVYRCNSINNKYGFRAPIVSGISHASQENLWLIRLLEKTIIHFAKSWSLPAKIWFSPPKGLLLYGSETDD